jgi:dihydrofolate reductase
MKVILHMAVTANGLIASGKEETPWSFEEWVDYCEAVVRAGNVIIGRKTYEIMKMAGDLIKIADQTVVVLTTRLPKEEGNVVFVNSPQKALEVLQSKGFTEALVAGGAKCNASFMAANVINEVCLNVEPYLFGSGVPLFSPYAFKHRLELLEKRSLNDNTIQLRYRICND